MREPRVVQADNAGLFALGGTRSYVLGRRVVAVVDPGPADRRHLERLQAEVGGPERGVIVLTHRHPDHAAGAPELSRRTGFPLRAGAPAEHAPGIPGEDAPLRDGEILETDEGPLEVVATPGHSRDHVCFLLGGSLLLAGDLILGQGDTTWVGEYAGCVSDYLRSLDRIQALEPDRILPAHGPPLTDPAAAVERFRAHRLERIRQVREVLEDLGPVKGPKDVEALVDRIYPASLPPRLREGALWSVRAILDHLGVMPFPEGEAPVEGGDALR